MPPDLRNSTAFWNFPRLPPFVILVRTKCRWKWVCSSGRMIVTWETRITWRRECPSESELLLKIPFRSRRNHSLSLRKTDRLISFRERTFFIVVDIVRTKWIESVPKMQDFVMFNSEILIGLINRRERERVLQVNGDKREFIWLI